jgi:dihydropyrimidine dehydrogenase (NAD+) subunit PreA
MKPDISVTFTGLKFTNPFLLSSAPPTESDSNIMRAFEAGWGGVVTKTIGLHPVTNVAGPKTKFLRSTLDGQLSMQKKPDTALHSSWNWELISDKALDWWIPKIEGIKKTYPDRMLIASIMAGSGSDKELAHWQDLAKACQDAGADAFELNLSCPHMDRSRQGSRARPGVGEADAVDDRDCRGSRRRLQRRRRCDRVVEHLPVAAPDRSGDA